MRDSDSVGTASAFARLSSPLRSVSFRLMCIVGLLHLLIATISRLALLWQARRDVDWDVTVLKAFGTGICFDLLATIYVMTFVGLLAWLVPAILWRRAGRWVIGSMLTVAAGLLVFIAVAEWFFWDEFQVRFNFIAVDYLVYTQEVVDNIKQSYPLPAVFGGLGSVALLALWGAHRIGAVSWAASGHSGWRQRTLGFLVLLVVAFGISLRFSQSQIPAYANQYNRELAKNGIYSFCAAFWESEIDYERFYRKLPVDEARARAARLLCATGERPASAESGELRRHIAPAGDEHRWNIVLISVESLSREFLAGREGRDLTPMINRVRKEGIEMTNLRATGTRTVRGLEALTLCVPPTPGQSIVWRPNNERLFSTGSLFARRGYDVAYLYGGDAFFDNMRYFFANNGYRVVDRQAKTRADITFQNAWGVCDEDLFRWAIAEADADAAKGKPFFLHVMTVSNHRPFTFPEGRIDMPTGTRDAAVKYTDFALGSFLEQARGKPWFGNTLFAVVADHCHSSAGKSILDVTKYHIPCFIWNPGLVGPRQVDALCSQIDLMPTVFGLMRWTYDSLFFGHDVLAPGYTADVGRAFVSNYQKICLLRPGALAMLMPKQQFVLGSVDLATGALTPRDPSQMGEQLDDTVALYQSAASLFRSGGLRDQTGQ